MALGICAALAAPGFAQKHPAANPPRPQPPRPAPRQQQRQQRQPARAAQNERQNSGGNRPPNANANRAATGRGSNNNPNRPPSAYTPSPQRKFNDLSPQEKQKVVENYNKQKNLTPAQRRDIDDRIKTWNKLTPEQQNHIRNDIAPKWRQLPPERRQAIRQRLQILQNMPESARNQHLNDANFTRGMSEEDKATLKDLSHMHVGGAPEPPGE